MLICQLGVFHCCRKSLDRVGVNRFTFTGRLDSELVLHSSIRLFCFCFLCGRGLSRLAYWLTRCARFPRLVRCKTSSVVVVIAGEDSERVQKGVSFCERGRRRERLLPVHEVVEHHRNFERG